MNKLSCGVDEAGRGPVIGPLVLACVILDNQGIENLKKLGVRDSKRLSPSKRESLEPEIMSEAVEWKLAKISPQEIDVSRKRISLNVLEAAKTAELILSLKNTPEKIFIDAADSIEEEYKKKIIFQIKQKNPEYEIPEMVCEHKADDNYVPVSAASVLAKVERDRVIEKLREEYGNFGSGYPSDELTQKFIRRLVLGGNLPYFVRRSWQTVDKSRQSSLVDF